MSNLDPDYGTLREDLRQAWLALAPTPATVARAIPETVWPFLRDRQLARWRRSLRPAAAVTLNVLDAVHRRGRAGWPGCGPGCTEGHTYVWPCELAPPLPESWVRRWADDNEGHAEQDPDTPPDEDPPAVRSWGEDPPDPDQALRSPLA